MLIANTCTGTIINTTKVESFFKSVPKNRAISYTEYWDSIRPKNTEDIFRRYLFAYCSVHTTWKGNCAGYNAIKNFNEWIDNKEILRNNLRMSGVGLHNNRTNYIWDFSNKFWANPKNFYFTNKKYHVKKRDQIVKNIMGLGMAKVSFALEMIHPTECRVLCGDVHILRLYGMEHLTYTNKSGADTYKKMERHWSILCGKNKIPSYIARSLYWDNVQNQEDSKYWSYVLEDE